MRILKRFWVVLAIMSIVAACSSVPKPPECKALGCHLCVDRCLAAYQAEALGIPGDTLGGWWIASELHKKSLRSCYGQCEESETAALIGDEDQDYVVSEDNQRRTPRGLDTFVLTDSDFPEGHWRLTNAVAMDNRMSARESARAKDSPDDWLRRFGLWGRIDGYRAECERQLPDSVVEDHVGSEVEIFKSVSGAIEAFRAFQDINESDSTLQKGLEALGVRLQKLETQEDIGIGDESYTTYLRMVGATNPGPRLEAMSVNWRGDEMVSSVTWIVSGSTIFEPEVIELARAQDERIKRRLPGFQSQE
jgi:hypothetical protein